MRKKSARRAAPPRLWIVGTGSQARYVIEVVNRDRSYRPAGLIDIERENATGQTVNGVPILGSLKTMTSACPPGRGLVVVAYGDNQKKMEIVRRLESAGYRFATIVSSFAYISATARIAEGCILNPYCVVMPNAVLGRHVILHSNVLVEHDCVLEDAVNVGPGVAMGGNVRVGACTTVYTGAAVIPKITIGRNCIIGAGAAVIRDVPDNTTVVGVPARPVSD